MCRQTVDGTILPAHLDSAASTTYRSETLCQEEGLEGTIAAGLAQAVGIVRVCGFGVAERRMVAADM